MFSLCIPTMDRFDSFLSKNLDKYKQNDMIGEIIICDENGNDYKKLKEKYGENEKIKIHKNEKILGPFMNKLKVCSYATNEWICLIDSDNFAPLKYFTCAKNYIEEQENLKKETILTPSFAMPNFDYRQLEDLVLNKTSKTKIDNADKKKILLCWANTGNFIINKYIIDNIDISNETNNIKSSPSCDVIYFNTLVFEQFDSDMHILKNLHYNHKVHNGSIYIQTTNKYKEFEIYVRKRFNNYFLS